MYNQEKPWTRNAQPRKSSSNYMVKQNWHQVKWISNISYAIHEFQTPLNNFGKELTKPRQTLALLGYLVFVLVLVLVFCTPN
jgi:hypothetical protein